MKKIIFILLIFIIPAGNALALEAGGGEIHGFISQGYLDSSDNNILANDSEDGTFQFREIGINFGKWIKPGLYAGFQLFANDIGVTGDNEVEIDWAVIDWRWQDWLGFKIGRIKTPLGIYNEIRDVDMLRTWILLPQSVYLEPFRDGVLAIDGGAVYGSLNTKNLGKLSYMFVHGTLELELDSGMARTIEGAIPEFLPVEIDDFEFDSRTLFHFNWETPLEGLRFSFTTVETDLKVITHFTEDVIISFMIDPPGPPPAMLISKTLVQEGDKLITQYESLKQSVYSVDYTWNDLFLVAEYTRQTQRSIDTTFSSTEGPTETHKRQDPEGYYYSAAYRFNHWFELGAYYSKHYTDKNDKDGTLTPYDPVHKAWRRDKCVTLRFDLNQNWILKLEGHTFDGSAYLNRLDHPPVTEGDRYEKNWKLFAAKLTFYF